MESSTWLLIALLVIILLLYDYRNRSFFKHLGVPATRSLPFIGHFHLLKKGFVTALDNMHKEHGKVYGLFFGGVPILVIADADMLKEILVRKFSHFYNRRDTAIDDHPFQLALTRLKGARWKEVRNTITPAFSASKMKPVALLFNECCDVLLKQISTKIKENPVIEVKGLYGSMTMDAIARGAFGIDLNSIENPNSPFVQHAKAFFKMSLWNPVILISLIAPSLCPILNYFKIGFTPKASKQFFLDVTCQAMAMKSKGSKERVDILQMMVNAQEEESTIGEEETIPDIAGAESDSGPVSSKHKTKLTLDEIMAQSIVFFLAGYETTNVGLSLVSYLCALNPDIQDRLLAEVDEMAPTPESVTYDTVNKMQYLDMVLNETLRLYPPGVIADRVAVEACEVGDLHIPKDTGIFYNIFALHHDPEYWEEPERFDPERFSKENKEKIHPFAYLPFGTGPRNCIGMRFAILILKLTIVRVLQKFQFEPCEKTEIPLSYGKRSIIPDAGITLRILDRE